MKDLDACRIAHPSPTGLVAYRRQFALAAVPASATVALAAPYFMLWINGELVTSGPVRAGRGLAPEYGVVEVARYLRSGDNVIALVAYHDAPVALRLDCRGLSLATDTTWRCNDNTRFKASFFAVRHDASGEDGEWLLPGYDDRRWTQAVARPPGNIPRLRSMPFVRITDPGPCRIAGATPIPLPLASPLVLDAGALLKVEIPRSMYGNCMVEIEADAPAEVTVLGKTLVARPGRQRFATYGYQVMYSPVSAFAVISGRVRLVSLRLGNVRYPFDRPARFACTGNGGEMLTRLWDVCTWGVMQCTPDAYVDGSRECSEWMGDAAIVHWPVTRIAFAGPGDPGAAGPRWADPRPLRNILRHVASAQMADGRLPANYPPNSDIHGYIEDYATRWIGCLRSYLDSTGDLDLVQELWPVAERQLKWFIDRIQPSGLVLAREFMERDNPVAYQTCEGATVNAFVYMALLDGAALCEARGDNAGAMRLRDLAGKLAAAFDRVLWDGTAYRAAPGKPPTIHAVVMALEAGLVPAERLAAARAYLVANAPGSVRGWPPSFHYLWRQLYRCDSEVADRMVLDQMRERCARMASDPCGMTGEGFEPGFHVYGAVPAALLTGFVLGVRVEEPVARGRIVIEPRLADLDSVEGAAVTEFGLVPTSWRRTADRRALDFTCTVPAGVRAALSLPMVAAAASVVVDGREIVHAGVAVAPGVTLRGRFAILEVGPGAHSGRIGAQDHRPEAR